MSKYDYGCEEHGKFEELHAIGEAPDTSECPSCGKICKRVFSPQDALLITPARWGQDKAGIREVTGGYSMNDIKNDGALRRRFLG